MTGAEFLRKVKRLGKRRGFAVELHGQHGKGSHARLYYGKAFTALKDRKKEIGPGLMRKMCRDLGIDPREL